MEKLNLQLFAEPPVEPDDTGETGAPNENNEPVALTQEDIDKAIEAALAKEREKWEADAQKKIEDAEKKAKMSAEELAKAEIEEGKAQLASERAELARQKVELALTKSLASEKLPVEFAQFLMAEDEDKALKNVQTFKTAFDKAVENAVNERLKGSTPKTGSTTAAVTQEEFDKMSYGERAKLMAQNPELYKTLAKK